MLKYKVSYKIADKYYTLYMHDDMTIRVLYYGGLVEIMQTNITYDEYDLSRFDEVNTEIYCYIE